MKNERWITLSLLMLCIVLSACTKKDVKTVNKDSAEKKVIESLDSKATEDAKNQLDEKANIKKSTSCLSKFNFVGDEKLWSSGTLNFKAEGDTVELLSSDIDNELIIGQVTDIKDNTPNNQKNLDQYIAWFSKENVDIVVITGDIGESKDAIVAVLSKLATLSKPILAIVGNRESMIDYNSAIDEVHAKYPHVINMNKTRIFNTDDAAIVSLPGYFNADYIHSPEGCLYSKADVDSLKSIAEKTKIQPRVLISHGPPKMKGDKALDAIHERDNVGDPYLADFMVKNSQLFPFGLFGNIQESGGYATNISGQERIAPSTYINSLYLNPGPADSLQWAMLDGSYSYGMAGILQIKGQQARYKIFKIKPKK